MGIQTTLAGEPRALPDQCDLGTDRVPNIHWGVEDHAYIFRDQYRDGVSRPGDPVFRHVMDRWIPERDQTVLTAGMAPLHQDPEPGVVPAPCRC